MVKPQRWSTVTLFTVIHVKKSLRSRLLRVVMRMEADPYWLNEKILRKYFGRDMHPDLLESEGFDFEKYREKIIIKGETVFAMKKFAFSILKNKTVRIWKQW